MKASFPSEKVFQFEITKKSDLSLPWSVRKRITVPLVSEHNLDGLLRIAKQIRAVASLQNAGVTKFVDEKEVLSKLPTSTNNVIYVGDIMLEKKGMKEAR